jgi:hypothetical protein
MPPGRARGPRKGRAAEPPIAPDGDHFFAFSLRDCPERMPERLRYLFGQCGGNDAANVIGFEMAGESCIEVSSWAGWKGKL